MSEKITNRVEESGLITLDPAQFLSAQEQTSFDIKEHLFMGMILKEKDFREALEKTDWLQYQDKIVALHCSADAIIPMWAYMLVTSKLIGVAKAVYRGNPEEVTGRLLSENIRLMDANAYQDKRVVVKGCGDTPIPPEAYVEITAKLSPVVKSLMFGEPCSTVPIYKRK